MSYLRQRPGRSASLPACLPAEFFRITRQPYTRGKSQRACCSCRRHFCYSWKPAGVNLVQNLIFFGVGFSHFFDGVVEFQGAFSLTVSFLCGGFTGTVRWVQLVHSWYIAGIGARAEKLVGFGSAHTALVLRARVFVRLVGGRDEQKLRAIKSNLICIFTQHRREPFLVVRSLGHQSGRCDRVLWAADTLAATAVIARCNSSKVVQKCSLATFNAQHLQANY